MNEESDTIVISVISQKGGVSKSSIVRAVAREAAKNGLNTKIADLDTQQATSKNWADRRESNEIKPVIPTDVCSTASQAIDAAQGHDVLVIDAPARASQGTYEIATHSDLIIQPTGASLDDLEPAILLFHELTDKGIKPEKLFFALSRVGTPAEEKICREYIDEAGYKTLDGCIYEKPAYRQAQNQGYALTEVSYKGLRGSADKLIQSLIDKLEG